MRAAVPFSLKLMESLLAESPRHQGLLFATASGFTQYAYAFVQQDAEELEGRDVEAALAMRNRARRLYLRARDYALRGLDAAHPGFADQLRAEPVKGPFTNELSESRLSLAEQLWRERIATCGQSVADTDPLPPLMHELAR